MNILSLDNSTKSTGWSVFEDGVLKDYGCITSSSSDLFKRIHIMVDAINELIKKHNITKIVMEEVRPDTGLNLATHKALMFLQGAIFMMLHDNYPKVTTELVLPSEWRKVCKIKQGRGITRDAVKKNDIAFVQEKFGITVNDDIADACCIGYAFLHPEDKKENILMWGE